MKTLKLTVLAIFAIVLLTGVSQLKEEVGTNGSSNHEINQPKVKLTALKGVTPKPRQTPAMS